MYQKAFRVRRGDRVEITYSLLSSSVLRFEGSVFSILLRSPVNLRDDTRDGPLRSKFSATAIETRRSTLLQLTSCVWKVEGVGENWHICVNNGRPRNVSQLARTGLLERVCLTHRCWRALFE